MRTRLLIFSILFLLSGFIKGQAPPWVWANEANSAGSEYAWDVISDTISNNVYIGGTFDGDISAKYGPAFTASYGGDDGFLAKYTNNGIFQWALKIGGTSNDQVKSVTVDPAGDVYVGGYFNGTADFDPSAATFNLTSSGAMDGFLAKYSSAGIFLWAVKYGGSGNDEPWKMYADGNGIYLTGSYSSAPVTFNSYGSGVTKTTTSANTNGEMFGVKYNSSGIAQWAISGGGTKIDCGYSVVADGNNAYFIGRYDEDITFKNSSGVASALLQAQQSNKQQVFIIAYTQSIGVFAWQTNITCNASKDVVGYTIAQDAANLYVSGYLEDDINFKYPSPTLTQTHTGGGSFDIFLAQLTKAGTFTWRAAVTGSGAGEQVGRCVDVDHNGNVILSGHYMGNLNYSAAGGPTLSASAKDIFVTSYSNAGTFQWATKAGNNGDDFVYGMAVDNSGGIYVAGSDDNGAIFGTYTLTVGGGVDNIYVAKLGCNALGNNTISASQTVCSGNAPSLLTGALPTGSGPYTYVWEKSPDNTSWVNATGTYTNQNYAPPPLTSSTYYRRKVIVSGVCASILTSTSILISVDLPPSVSNAGTSQTLCSSSATLTANTPTTGTGVWTVITGTSSLTSTTTASTSANSLSNGANSFVWTISNGTCPSSSSTVTISRDVMPSVSNAGVSQTICASSTTLSANTPTTGTGVWSVITGTSSLTSTTAATTNANGLSNGPNDFVWTISNGTCPSSSSTVTITKDIMPSVSNAGISQTICASSTTLSANTPTTGTGVWTVITGTSSLTSTTTAATNANGLSNGTNEFVWIISNGTCPSSSSTVTVTRDLPPTISNAGASQTLCATTASLNANNPTVGLGTWSVISGSGNITTLNNPLSNVSGLSDGNNDLVWTISNGVCPSSSSTVTITKDVMPSVSNAGSSQAICASSVTLSANTPTTGTGVWSVVTGTSSLASTTVAATNVTGLSNGANDFVWTISNGTCPSSSSTVTITRDVMPSVSNAGTSQTICASSATLSANTPITGTGAWSVITGTSSLTSTTAAVTNANGLSNGTNDFVWTISNGTCPSLSSTVTITRDVMPSVSNAGTSQTICASSATLSANTPTTGTGVWIVITGTSSLTSTTAAVTNANGLSNGTNEFVWTISNGTCPSSSSTVTVTRDVMPTISNAGSSQTLCATTANLNANNPTVGLGTWNVLSGTGNVTNANNPITTISNLSDGNNDLVWTIANGVCPSSSSTVTIVKDLSPTIPNAGNDQTICSSNSTLNANTPVNGTALWTAVSGSGSISNPSLSGTSVTGLSIGTNYFVWTISNGTCSSLSDTVIIIQDEMPTTAIAGTDKLICTATDNLNANTPLIGSGQWSVLSGSGTIINSTIANSTVSNLSTGTNSFVWSISNGVCPVSYDTMQILVDANPTMPNAGNDKTICSDNFVLQGNIVSTGSGTWSVISGTGVFVDPTLHNTTVSSLGIGINILRWTIQNGVCPVVSDEVSIIQDELPSIASASNDLQTDYPIADLVAVAPVVGIGLWSVIEGPAEIADATQPTVSATNLGIGNNVFRWTVRNGVCPESTDDILVELNPLKIPNAFSPNEDGINEAFVVPGLEYYSNVKFSVFNRWSALLYESNNYKNEWTGLNSSKEKLADDTYYYTLELPSIDKKYTGYIIIKTTK